MVLVSVGDYAKRFASDCGGITHQLCPITTILWRAVQYCTIFIIYSLTNISSMHQLWDFHFVEVVSVPYLTYPMLGYT